MKIQGYIHDGWFVLRLPNTIDSNYFWYLLSSPLLSDQFKSLASGAIVKNISGDLVKKSKLPIPPLTEQKQIVVLLDQAFKAINQAQQNIEKNIANAKELFQSKLNAIFSQTGEGWEEQTLKTIVDIKTGKLNANAMVEGGKYSFFTCSREIFAIDKYAFDCEAILLAGNNASGDFNVKHFKGKFNAYQRTYVITAKEDNVVSYGLLKYKLINHLKSFKQQSLGANTKFLKIGMIQNLVINLPSYEEQQLLVENLDQLSTKLENTELVYNYKLKNLEELKKSILQKAFNGELT